VAGGGATRMRHRGCRLGRLSGWLSGGSSETVINRAAQIIFQITLLSTRDGTVQYFRGKLNNQLVWDNSRVETA
jgi:hypothetical protein